MRKPLIAGNWKMNLLAKDAVSIVEKLWSLISDVNNVEVVICPPFIDIPAVSKIIREREMDILLGAQNMHWEESGAFTGEISPVMLLEFGISHVIIGHSERRQYFGETDQAVNRKVRSAIEHRLVPIMCVGESLKERETGQTEMVVNGQVKRGLFELTPEQVRMMVIAYEPIWAIGTGKAAKPEDASEVSSLIRKIVSEEFGEDTADNLRILYGGSVNSKNAGSFFSSPEIDGALVGGASLNPEDFSSIVRSI